MTQTADDLVEKIAGLAEDLKTKAETQIRTELADAILDLVKQPQQVTNYLHNEDVPIKRRNHRTGQTETVGVTKYRSYLPEIKNPDEFETTPDFLKGLRFAAALLKDRNFEW